MRMILLEGFLPVRLGFRFVKLAVSGGAVLDAPGLETLRVEGYCVAGCPCHPIQPRKAKGLPSQIPVLRRETATAGAKVKSKRAIGPG